MRPLRPQAWNFTRSRDFIIALDAWARVHRKGYSRRAFAKWAKVSSPNFVSLVINGKRPLTAGWAKGVVVAAKLDEGEAKYFNLLISLEGERDQEKREVILKSMKEILQTEPTTSLAGSLLELIENPSAWTIYHMLGLEGQTSDPFWFKSRLRDKLSVEQIRSAIHLLLRLKLISPAQNSSRGWIAKFSKLESGDQFSSAQNRSFHRHVLKESERVLNEIAVEERIFGSLTVAVPKEREEEFKAEINLFGKLLLEKYASDRPTTGELFRINLQLYPLTQNLTEKSS